MKEQESKSSSDVMRHEIMSSSDTMGHESNKSLSEKTRHEKKSPFDTVEHKSPKHTDADRKGSAEVEPRDLLHVNT